MLNCSFDSISNEEIFDSWLNPNPNSLSFGTFRNIKFVKLPLIYL